MIILAADEPLRQQIGELCRELDARRFCSSCTMPLTPRTSSLLRADSLCQAIHDSSELCFSGTQCLHLTKSEREPLCTHNCCANLASWRLPGFLHRSKWTHRCLAVPSFAQQTASVGITMLLNLHDPLSVAVSGVVPIRPTVLTPV